MNETQNASSEERPKRVREQPAPNDRGEGWIEAFNTQVADRDLHRSALKFAQGCVSMLQRCDVQVASAFAEDLVASAIADTWRGVLSWKPRPEWTLLEHIKAAIRSRARDEWKRAQKFPSASLDAHEGDEDTDRGAGLWSEAEKSLAANAPAVDASTRIFAIEAFDRLRVLAKRDREIVKLLDAMRTGATERTDLMRATGMSARRYESVRRRLDRLLQELPASMLHRVHVASSCTSTRPRAMRHVVPPCGGGRRGGAGGGDVVPPAAYHARGRCSARVLGVAHRAPASDPSSRSISGREINSAPFPNA